MKEKLIEALKDEREEVAERLICVADALEEIILIQSGTVTFDDFPESLGKVVEPIIFYKNLLEEIAVGMPLADCMS